MLQSFVRCTALSIAATVLCGADPITTTGEAPATPDPVIASPDAECSEELVNPKVLSKPQLVVPKKAKRKGIEGTLSVVIDVSAEGHVTAASVTKGLGYGVDEACENAWMATSWKPATRCGVPVAVTGILKQCTVMMVK